MEQGVDGVLLNTAIAAATDPVRMALAMRLAMLTMRSALLVLSLLVPMMCLASLARKDYAKSGSTGVA